MASPFFFRVGVLAPVVGAAWLAVTAACGPSFQVVYEGNARFEHCYALEENPQIPMPEKAGCWQNWSEHYTYGQTRDRVQYATARYVALNDAKDAPTDEALMMAAPGQTPRTSVITAPAPTNAFAPPPKVLEQAQPIETNNKTLGDAGAKNAPEAAKMVSYPAATCSDACQSTFQSCSTGCDGDAGFTKACKTCTSTYRTCMKACFK